MHVASLTDPTTSQRRINVGPASESLVRHQSDAGTWHPSLHLSASPLRTTPRSFLPEQKINPSLRGDAILTPKFHYVSYLLPWQQILDGPAQFGPACLACRLVDYAWPGSDAPRSGWCVEASAQLWAETGSMVLTLVRCSSQVWVEVLVFVE